MHSWILNIQQACSLTAIFYDLKSSSHSYKAMPREAHELPVTKQIRLPSQSFWWSKTQP